MARTRDDTARLELARTRADIARLGLARRGRASRDGSPSDTVQQADAIVIGGALGETSMMAGVEIRAASLETVVIAKNRAEQVIGKCAIGRGRTGTDNILLTS